NKGKPAPLTLEEMLAQAAESNPDVRVAEAKLREAEAELNRTRLQVTQKVVKLYQECKAQRSTLEEAEQRLKAAEKLLATGALPQRELDKSRAAVVQAKARLESLEAEIPFVVGKAERGRSKPATDPNNMATDHIRMTVRLWDVFGTPVERPQVQLYL